MKRVDKRFVEACRNGDLENVRYLLTSKKFKINADIHADDDYGFKEACEEGHLEVVKYLLTSPDLKEHADIHLGDDYGFKLACLYGNFDIVKYLLTSPDLKEHANIHADNDKGLRFACYHGDLEVVKYLLTSPDLKEHADMHAKNNDGIIRGFENAIKRNKLDVVRFLIFDFNICKDIVVEILAHNGKNDDVKDEISSMFDKREFEKRLHASLKVNQKKPVKRTKI